jgi:hypothetical protein
MLSKHLTTELHPQTFHLLGGLLIIEKFVQLFKKVPTCCPKWLHYFFFFFFVVLGFELRAYTVSHSTSTFL